MKNLLILLFLIAVGNSIFKSEPVQNKVKTINYEYNQYLDKNFKILD